MPIAEAVSTSDLRQALRQDHDAIERGLEHLLMSARMNDWERLRGALSEIERDLRAHLEAEETFMLPKFERVDAERTRHIREEHAEIEKRLVDLGVALDLHALRDSTIEQFVKLLQEHARGEERALYSWAQAALGEQEKASALSRLRARLRPAG
jgi:hemerythrin superfamily protein